MLLPSLGVVVSHLKDDDLHDVIVWCRPLIQFKIRNINIIRDVRFDVNLLFEEIRSSLWLKILK